MNNLMLAAKEFIRWSFPRESPDKVVKQLFDKGVKLSLTQEYIIRVLDTGMTDDDLFNAYHREMFAPKQTHQGIRSRRAELVKMGLVQEVGTVISKHRRKTRLWARK
jgi:hypothetical protein